MKKTTSLLVMLVAVIFMFSLVFTLTPSAQQTVTQKKDPGMTPGNLYDPKTVETIRGVVVNLEEFTMARGMPPGVQVMMKAESGEVFSVFLGPQWYIEDQDFEIQPKDAISVKGSRAVFEGKPALVAAVVFKGDRILKLRNEQGIPVWSPWIQH
jgi:hypothetical protein